MAVNSAFSGDLLEEILCRLTVRQLLRLRCVSSLWCSSIDNHSFSSKHYKFQYSKLIEEKGDVTLFADDPTVPEFFLISKDLQDIVLCVTPEVKRDSGPHFPNDPECLSSFFCMGVVNGIVLFHMHAERLSLWNPATREFKMVPHPRPNKPDNVTVIERFGMFLGMGFDPKSYDFKIVRETDWTVGDGKDWKRNFICETYSVRANSWKSLEFPWPSLHMNRITSDGYFNGVHYWPANFCPPDNESTRFLLLAFDFGTENFKLANPPPSVNKDVDNVCVCKWEEYNVCKYMEFLAVTVTFALSDTRQFELWIANDFEICDDNGIPMSWQHLFTVGPIAAFDGLWFHAFLMDGDVLVNVLSGNDCETALYSPTTCTFKRLGVGVACNLRFVESLFQLSKT